MKLARSRPVRVRPRRCLLLSSFCLAALTSLVLLGMPRTTDASIWIFPDQTAENTGASFKAEFSFEIDSGDASQATVTVTIHNNTPSSIGSYLTAFVFNSPLTAAGTQNLIADVALTVDSEFADFELLGAPSFDNSVNAKPFGEFDVGAGLGGKFQGGGNPGDGIQDGASGSFIFELTAAPGESFAGITEDDFVNALSDNGNKPGEFFAVRFRGVGTDGNDSDKLSGRSGAVPEPATLTVWLGAAVSVCFGVGVRRWRKKS